MQVPSASCLEVRLPAAARDIEIAGWRGGASQAPRSAEPQ